MTAFPKVAAFLQFLEGLVHATLAELALLLKELNQPLAVDLPLLKVGFVDFNGGMVQENFTDFRQLLRHLTFFGLADRFKRAVFLDELEPGLGPDALDARVVGADHDGQVHQLFSAELVAREHFAEIDGLSVNHPPVALGAVVHQVANEHG